MGLAGSAEYYTALDTAMGSGLTVDPKTYGLEGEPVVFHAIAYAGLADLMMRRRSNAHAAYECTTQKMAMRGRPIDFRLRAADLNTILFGRGPQDLASILTDPELAPEVLATSLRGGMPLKRTEKEDPKITETARYLLADEKIAEAVMYVVWELTTGIKHPDDPTLEAKARGPDPTTQPGPIEPSEKTGAET